MIKNNRAIQRTHRGRSKVRGWHEMPPVKKSLVEIHSHRSEERKRLACGSGPESTDGCSPEYYSRDHPGKWEEPERGRMLGPCDTSGSDESEYWKGQVGQEVGSRQNESILY